MADYDWPTLCVQPGFQPIPVFQSEDSGPEGPSFGRTIYPRPKTVFRLDYRNGIRADWNMVHHLWQEVRHVAAFNFTRPDTEEEIEAIFSGPPRLQNTQQNALRYSFEALIEEYL